MPTGATPFLKSQRSAWISCLSDSANIPMGRSMHARLASWTFQHSTRNEQPIGLLSIGTIRSYVPAYWISTETGAMRITFSPHRSVTTSFTTARRGAGVDECFLSRSRSDHSCPGRTSVGVEQNRSRWVIRRFCLTDSCNLFGTLACSPRINPIFG